MPAPAPPAEKCQHLTPHGSRLTPCPYCEVAALNRKVEFCDATAQAATEAAVKEKTRADRLLAALAEACAVICHHTPAHRKTCFGHKCCAEVNRPTYSAIREP